MKLKIKDEEIELVYSFRINLYYEEISGKSIDFQNISANDLINLFYATVISSLQKAKKPTISMLDFMDVVDDNGGEKLIVDFSNWYVEIVKAQYEMLPEDDKDKVNAGKKKKG